MNAAVSDYSGLLTSAYGGKPKITAEIEALADGPVDSINATQGMAAGYDIDTAVGAQLDAVGEWVGVTRDLQTAIAGVFFAFDTPGLGFDEGQWASDASMGGGGTLIRLDDGHYRTLLRARILNNHWNGTIDKDPALYVGGDVMASLLPGAVDQSAYAIWDVLFAGTGYELFIVDHGDLSMTMGILYFGGSIDAVTLALFTGGYLNVKPAGVRIRDHISASGMPPIFALDSAGADFAGLDIGSWAVSV